VKGKLLPHPQKKEHRNRPLTYIAFISPLGVDKLGFLQLKKEVEVGKV